MREGSRWRLVDGAKKHEVTNPISPNLEYYQGHQLVGMGLSALALLLYFACFLDFRLVLRLGLGRANTTRPCRVQAGGLG